MKRFNTILPLLAIAFVSCGEQDEIIGFPPGEYVSTCSTRGSDSLKSEINIARDFKSQTVQTFVYSGVSNCSGTGVPEAEPLTSDILIVFSNINLGSRFSYLTTTFDENGVTTEEFKAFRFENSRLYFSPSVSQLGEDPKVTFADFIADPDFIAELVLFRKDLNRPLSKN